MTKVLTTISAMRAVRAAQPAEIALVPTMGALHPGHFELVRQAQRQAGVTVVSIFVNPLQFAENEDLERYPKTLDEDVAALSEIGVDYVFAPTVQEMYPSGRWSGPKVIAGEVGNLFEGASRPGHFDGVLTVVAKLFNIVQPNRAFFGQKDAQQLFLIRQMVSELNFPVVIETVGTVREEDGLALSSRNRFLDDNERVAALVLSRALQAAADAAAGGVEAALSAAGAVFITTDSIVDMDYLAIIDPNTFGNVPADSKGSMLVLVAAHVGATRLIDNRLVEVGSPAND